MKLTLPLPPNRANAREHWRVTDRKKNDYYVYAAAAIHNQRPSGWWPSGNPTRMRLDATLYLWARMDLDNLVSRLKWILDSLVNYGLLMDDNEKWLDLQMPKQVVDRKNPRVEIELTPLVGREE